jgi:hemoglobin-like flavoprotein
MLTDEQRQTLRFNFDPLLPLPKKLVLDVFAELVKLDPNLEESFRGELDEKAAQFSLAFSSGMVHLIDEGQISEAVRQLGVRLRAQAFLERDYDTLGRALLAVFERKLGPDLTLEGRAAWGEAWDELSTAMQKAATAASVVG